MDCIDGNFAAAHVAYALSDASFIYPITPSSPMGEHIDAWAGANRKNCFGRIVEVTEMQSEAGAAGAVHGALAGGALVSTYTASQGLLLMLPNMFKIAGEGMPCVFHVAARAVAGQALSIFGDHSDVMATRQTGFCQLCSNNVQESMDLALVAHIAALKGSLPFIHFFDGFRTSHEIQKVEKLKYEDIEKLIPFDKVALHNSRSLHPSHPQIRGTAQGPDIFFQMVESSNTEYFNMPEIVEGVMADVGKLTGREYHIMQYTGAADATDVMVIMGSGVEVAETACKYLNAKGKKTGVLKVHLFRPWSAKHFMNCLPKTTQRIVVMDRTKESGALGEPLYLDVCACVQESNWPQKITIIGGRYGLGSKEFRPNHVAACFENLALPTPKNHFTVGINDDVTHLSLEVGPEITTLDADVVQCKFWGLGSDGTVGANKQAITIIGNSTPMYAQAYFAYDAHKSGGVTVSHLRFGKNKIEAPYLVADADYIGVHHPMYVLKYDVASSLKQGGLFVLNSDYTDEEINKIFPGSLKRILYAKGAKFYNIDALKIGNEVGLGKRINMIMQSVFFKLAEVIPVDEALGYLKKAVDKAFGHKGQKICDMNYAAIDKSIAGLRVVKIPESWKDAPLEKPEYLEEAPAFVNEVMLPQLSMKGNNLPVSTFLKVGLGGGIFPVGTTKFEKRGVSSKFPLWNSANCTQCNICSFVCPHAVIRPFLLTSEEAENAPEGYTTIKGQAQGDADVANYRFAINVSTYDCTGCSICTNACAFDALSMSTDKDQFQKQADYWKYAEKLPERGDVADRNSVRGSQFQLPLLEFSGCCEGCGETTNVKTLTQLFGDRMVIANATGCSSIWGGTAGIAPYTLNSENRGPTWGNSLFEDNAEYGLGIYKGLSARRNLLSKRIADVLPKITSPVLKEGFTNWLANPEDVDVCENTYKTLDPILAKDTSDELRLIRENRDLLIKTSHWIIGGDGWAYDIGYGGLDHVLASGCNVNVLVMDTEMYSNTGGQMSKATQIGAVAKFAAAGKRSVKKDLGLLAMTYRNVYVASICLAANNNQAVKAFAEAEAYDGPSLIIAYAPCMEHGFAMANSVAESKLAVDSGYWPLYRYNPENIEKKQNPFMLDSKKIKKEIEEFIKSENRFVMLKRQFPDVAKDLNKQLQDFATERHQRYKDMAAGAVAAKAEVPKEDSILILYGSETGHSESLANQLAEEAVKRGLYPRVMEADECDTDDLAEEKMVVILMSTAGQGDFPENAKAFWNSLSNADHPTLENTKFAVFGLGDTSYVFFCKPAQMVEDRLLELKGQRIIARANGDDQDPEMYETAWESWIPDFWMESGAKAPVEEEGLPAPAFEVAIEKGVSAPCTYIPEGAVKAPLVKKELMTPKDYDRDIRHYEVDISKTKLTYNLGDALAIYAENKPALVEEFLKFYGLSAADCVNIKALGNIKTAVPSKVSVLDLFTKVLDIFGRPSRKFYAKLARFANAEEKAVLLKLLSKEGKEEFSAMIKETVTYFDILKKFPSAKPGLEYLVEMINVIKPRYYSIASSPKANPKLVQLCIVVNDWTTPSKKYRVGLTTGFLVDQSVGTELFVSVKAGIDVPMSPKVPLVMVGLGTGIAPFRAMVQDRAWRKKNGVEVGPVGLYYGCRYEAKEYLYGEEFKQWQKDGVVTHLIPAFSRDQAHKIYVQMRIAEDKDFVFDSLFTKKGYFYLCGQALSVPRDVKNAITKVFMDLGKLTEEQAVKYIEDMVLAGRYTVEAY